MTHGIMQNVDRNVSVKDYEVLGEDKLLVFGDLFYTIQGEGPYGGVPAVFLRLAGCNKGDKVSCPFCDTAFQFDKGKVMTFPEILAAFQDVCGNRTVSLLVITGGEPTMQDNLGRFIEWFLDTTQFSSEDFSIQIESNGDRPVTYMPPWWRPGDCPRFELVVSPKVNPVSQRYMKLRDQVLDQVAALKFVISADPASPYYGVPDWATQADHVPIYVSPMAVYKRPVQAGEVANMWDDTLIDKQATAANYARAAELAMRFGFVVSLQKHLFLNLP